MDAELHRILLELDNKFDVDMSDYFKLRVKDRKELSKMIVKYFIPTIQENPLSIINLRRALEIKIQEGEEMGLYEICDLNKRILKELNSLSWPSQYDFLSE